MLMLTQGRGRWAVSQKRKLIERRRRDKEGKRGKGVRWEYKKGWEVEEWKENTCFREE